MTTKGIREMVRDELNEAGLQATRQRIELVWHHTLAPMDNNDDAWLDAMRDAIELLGTGECDCSTCQRLGHLIKKTN